ncbi:MAG: transcription-repair coupling factor, partial [Candidatus Devosia euplotis]|nr:transcription-repair coupling factor [Candidatus Devosia euplotis]
MNEIVVERPTRTIANVPDGMQPMVLAGLIEQRVQTAPDDAASIAFVARDGRRLQRLADILTAVLPGPTGVTLPAWDCLPYDRVSPNNVTIAARMSTLAALTANARGAVVLTTVNALIQRLPPRGVVEAMSFSAAAGRIVDSEKLIAWATNNGYMRVPAVRESGEFAVRGGLVDLFPAGAGSPLRFDFFGSQLESIRTFDADSQRTTGALTSIALTPMSEVVLTKASIRRFRQNYTAAFGGNTAGDTLYASISGGARYSGTEHWLPFFYDHLDTLAQYVGDAPFVFDEQASEAYGDRVAQIRDYYDAREAARLTPQIAGAGAPYKPVRPELLYAVDTHPYALAGASVIQVSQFMAPGAKGVDDAGGHIWPSFAAVRQAADTKLFPSVVERPLGERKA